MDLEDKKIIQEAQEIVGVKDDNLIYIIELLNEQVEHWKEEYNELYNKHYHPEDYEPVGEWWE